jgi:hypothetical protein
VEVQAEEEPMEGRAAVVVAVAPMAAVVAEAAAAEEEEAPTSSSSFRIVERITGSHLDLRQDSP